MTPAPELILLGNPRLRVNGEPVILQRRKAMALLAYLAVTRQSHARDALVSLLYPEWGESAGRAELRRILSALKTALPTDLLVIERDSITLGDGLTVDIDVFNRAAAANTIESLTAAVQVYGDAFMTGFSLTDSASFDDWQFEQREAYRRQFLRVIQRLTVHYTDQQEYERAIDYTYRSLSHNSLDESAYRALMRLYVRAGQPSQALRIYKECSRVLWTELHIQPDAETTQLYDMINANRDELPTTGVLPSPPRLIIGREHVFDEVIGRLKEPVTVIQGWPGVGKSTILAALAHHPSISERFPDGVLWTSLGATPRLFAELSLWARALKLPIAEPSSPEALSSQIRSALRHRKMLILVDDVWAVSHAMLCQVGGTQCATVFSTRQNDIASALAPTPDALYKLSVLSEASALELLSRLAPEVVDSHRTAALELVRDLEGLPLAIQVAGRMLRYEGQMGWGIDDLLFELKAGRKLLSSQSPSDVAQTPSSPTIAALLHKSTDMLTPEMRTRFIYLGMFAPKPATYDLSDIGVAWGERDPRAGIRYLIDRGLIEPAGAGRFQMHALLVLHARTLAEGLE